MAKRNSKTEFRDLEAALVCGEAFYRLAERFIDSIPGVDASIKRPTDQFGDVVACATNLSLAAEVFLKALLGACDVPVPPIHDLHSLYAALPLPVQADVQQRYSIQAQSLRLPTRVSITFAKGPIDEPPWDDSHKDPLQSKRFSRGPRTSSFRSDISMNSPIRPVISTIHSSTGSFSWPVLLSDPQSRATWGPLMEAPNKAMKLPVAFRRPQLVANALGRNKLNNSQ